MTDELLINVLRSVMNMDENSVDSSITLFEVYDRAFKNNQLKPFRNYHGEFFFCIEGTYKYEDGEYEYLTYCPDGMCIRHHKGDDNDKYTLDIPMVNVTGNTIIPNIGKFIKWTDVLGKVYQGRVHRISGSWVYVNVWDGHGLDTKSWCNSPADMSHVYDVALAVRTIEQNDDFLLRFNKVKPCYVFINNHNTLIHEINEYLFEDIGEETYVVPLCTGRDVWSKYYLEDYSIGYDNLSYVGYIYSYFEYVRIGDSFRKWDSDYHPIYEERCGRYIIESEPHICSHKFLPVASCEMINRRIPGIIVDSVIRKDQPVYKLITDLLT